MQWIKFFAFVNVACAAIRLARFNISTDQTTDFSGMPSPANGLFWGSISMLMWSVHRSGNLPDEKSLVAFTLILLAITSFLMIAPVRMFSFKFQKGGFAQNKIPYIYICLIILLPVVILALGQPFLSAVPLAIMLYMALSFVYHFGQKQSV